MPDFDLRRRMMVDTQIRPSDVTKFPIIEAFLAILRENFVPTGMEEAAYVGENLTIAPGRVMLEPRSLAKMLDEVNLVQDELALVIGAGQGYSAAIIGHIAQAVVALESDLDLAREAASNLSEAEIYNVAVVTGPLNLGASEHGPYDAILIEGAVEQVSDAVLSQLKEGGRIIAIFTEAALGVVRIGYKLSGKIAWRFAFNAGAPTLEDFKAAKDFVL
ncbi:MAG: protein-L-isoaspartate O-methyltransferase [Pseudomonadota bacterium]